MPARDALSNASGLVFGLSTKVIYISKIRPLGALADEPGVEVVSVQVDVAEPATVAVGGIPGAIPYESNCLAFEMRLGEGAGLAPEVLDRLGGVLRLRGVHSDEPHGVAVTLETNLNGISINHALDAGRDRIDLGARDKRRDPGDQNANPISLPVECIFIVEAPAP